MMKPDWWDHWSEHATWQEQARATVKARQEQNYLTWLGADGREEAELSFAGLWARSAAMAEQLFIDHDLERGDRVLLVYAPGAEFFVAFVACLRAGLLAVPSYPPDPAKLKRGLEKLALVSENCDAKVGLTDSAVNSLRVTTSLFQTWPSVRWQNTETMGAPSTSGWAGMRRTKSFSSGRAVALATTRLGRSASSGDHLERGADGHEDLTDASPSEVAFLQFTSGASASSLTLRPDRPRAGSTGDPKGVMISHSNIWHNLNDIFLPAQRRVFELRLGVAAAARLCDVDDDSERIIAVSWLPQYHDTDPLMWCVSVSVRDGRPTSPRRLRAISKYRARWTAAPDFGYHLCTKKVGGADLSSIDLSSLLLCACGAGQRCVPSQLRAFAEYFGPRCKFPDNPAAPIFIQNYGLAEHVVATCGEVGGFVPSKRRPDLVSCGSDFQLDVCIAHPETRTRLPDGTAGELWLSSGSVAQGYWGRPELSEETFHAQLEPSDGKTYLRTGDEAFMEDGRLYICGRMKDLIIIGGKNYYSDDLEVAANEAGGDDIRPGCLAAFSVEGEDDTEYACIVAEIRDEALEKSESLANALTSSVGKAVGIRPKRVVFIRQRTILKTTSGKLRRRAIRAALLADELQVLYDSSPKPFIRSASKDEEHMTRSLSRTRSASSFSDWAMSLAGCFTDEAAERDDMCSIEFEPQTLELTWSQALIDKAVSRGRPYELEDFLGTWHVLDNHYAVRNFHIKAENIIDDPTNQYQQHHRGYEAARVVAKVLITKDDADVRLGVGESIFAQLPHEIYVFVLHENGVVKFVPYKSSSRLLLAGMDSYDEADVEANLQHAEEFGCFRFGIVVGEGSTRRLMRLNRWATDNRYFWSAVNTSDVAQLDDDQSLIENGLAAHKAVEGSAPPGAQSTHSIIGRFGDDWMDEIRTRVSDAWQQEGEFTKGEFKEAPPDDANMAVACGVLDGDDNESTVVWDAALTIETPTDPFEAAVRRTQLAYTLSVILESLRTTVNVAESVDPQSSSVAELGMTSQEALQLQQSLAKSLASEIRFKLLTDPTLTIVCLADEILKSARGENEAPLAGIVPLDRGVDLGCTPLPQIIVDILQTLGVVLVLVAVSTALIPAYHFGYWVQWRIAAVGSKEVTVRRDNAPWSHIKVAHTKNVYTYGLLLPLLIPLFMASLTAVLIVAKWVIIGRYRVGSTRRGTVYFLRWWFVDRLCDQFELWVGLYVYDTVLINVVYALLGANIARTAHIDAPLREFDLVTVGAHATVSGSIYTRFFQPDRYMRFCRVIIGPSAEIKSSATVMPGCSLETGAVLEHNATMAPGMTLAEDSVYRASPAELVAANPELEPPSSFSWLVFELAKVAMLVCYLYATFMTTNVTLEYAMRQLDGYEWRCRYRDLIYFVTGTVMTMFLSGVLVVLFKWILIGRLRNGASIRDDLIWRLRTWFIEWTWHRIVFSFGRFVWNENGVLSALLLRALGMSKGVWTSNLAMHYFFTPVEADLISVGEAATLSNFRASCKSTSSGTYKSITIGAGAQVGWASRLNAGCVLGNKAVVGHQTTVAEDQRVDSDTVFFVSSSFKKDQDGKIAAASSSWSTYWVCRFAQSLLHAMTFFVLACVCLVPAYELAVLLFYGDANYFKSSFYRDGWRWRDGQLELWKPPMNRNLALVLLGSIVLVVYASWAIAFRVWQWLVLGDFKQPERFLTNLRLRMFYQVYQGKMCRINAYILPVIRGSWLANKYMTFFGAVIEPDTFVNNTHFYDPTLLRIGHGVAIDSGSANVAHIFEKGHLVFREKIIQDDAILHPGSMSWAGDVVPAGCILGPRSQLASDASTDKYTPGTYLQGCPAEVCTELYRSAVVADSYVGVTANSHA